MTTIRAESLFYIAIFAAVVALTLFGLLLIRSLRIHERGHLIFSLVPWIHVLASYLFAFYIRVGFGAWPRSCIDNPDLELVGMVTPIALGALFVLFFLPPVWLGWLIIRLRRGAGRFWLPATMLFASGLAALITALTVDPWGFWSWVWD